MRKHHLFGAYLALACVCFFWGTTYMAIRISVQSFPPLWMVAVRQILAGLLICGYFLARGYAMPNLRQMGQMLIAGFMLIILGNGLVSWAEVHVSSGLAALLCSSVPFWIIGINALMHKKETFNGKSLIGLLVGVTGVVVIFFDNLKDISNPAYLAGILAIVVANVGWAAGTVYTKSKQTDPNDPPLSPLFNAGLQMLLAGVVMIPLAMIFDKPFPVTFTPESLWALGYLILFGSILAFGSYVYALSRLPSTVVSLYAYINPIVAVMLGWLILDEKLSMAVLAALGLILLGVFIVNKSMETQKSPSLVSE